MQENYLRPVEKQRVDDAVERAAQAAQLIAMADGMSGSFELGGTMSLLGTVYPTALMASKESFAKPAFPAYLQQLGAALEEQVGGDVFSRDVPDFGSWFSHVFSRFPNPQVIRSLFFFARSVSIVVLFCQEALTPGDIRGILIQGKEAPSPRTSEFYRS